MRIGIRSVLGALLAVLVLGAVAASGASAFNFRVEGKPLTGTEAFTGSGFSGGMAKVHINVDGTNLNFECKQSAASGSLETGGSWQSEITFKECAITEPAPCQLGANGITLHTVGLLESTEQIYNDGDGFGGTIFTFEVTGCTLAGSYAVTGYWKCELPEAGYEKIYHEENCKKSGSHLKANGLEGSSAYGEQIKLVSGKTWSVE